MEYEGVCRGGANKVYVYRGGIEKGNFAYLDEEELQIVYDNLLHSKEKPVESVSIQEVKEETVQTVEVVKEEKAPREQRPKFQKTTRTKDKTVCKGI